MKHGETSQDIFKDFPRLINKIPGQEKNQNFTRMWQPWIKKYGTIRIDLTIKIRLVF